MADTPFAEFITNRRRELELTLGDVANGLGVSPITVSSWSSGDATPEPDQLVALAELLEVPSDDLAGMAGVKLKAPEPAVNLMPAAAAPADEPDPDSEESTGPIAMLKTADDTDTDTDTDDPVAPVPDREDQAEDVAADSASSAEPAATEADTPEEAPDEIDSELADLIEEAAAEEQEEATAKAVREPPPAVVTKLPGAEEEKQRPARRRPSIRRRRPAAEQPVTALPLTYVEDPKQLTRYRIRWALTVIILVVMFFILLWASRELLSALSEVRQAVTPGGIGS